jgi:hypothetical protein
MRDGTAVIKVNGIEVGAMPLERYEAIVKEVKEDWRTRIAILFDYVRVIWKAAARLSSYFVHSFVVVTAIFMIYSMNHSPEITQFVTDLRSLPPERIAEGFSTLARMCISLTMLAFVISYILIGAPVFVSASERAINKKIREVMEVPAEGQVSVTFKKDGVYCVR